MQNVDNGDDARIAYEDDEMLFASRKAKVFCEVVGHQAAAALIESLLVRDAGTRIDQGLSITIRLFGAKGLDGPTGDILNGARCLGSEAPAV